MKEKIANIKKEFLEEIKKVKTEQQLAELKVKHVGKKGALTQVLRGMGSLSQEERPVIGSLVNEVRDEIEKLVEEKKKEFKQKELQKKMQGRKLCGLQRQRLRLMPRQRKMQELKQRKKLQ